MHVQMYSWQIRVSQKIKEYVTLRICVLSLICRGHWDLSNGILDETLGLPNDWPECLKLVHLTVDISTRTKSLAFGKVSRGLY